MATCHHSCCPHAVIIALLAACGLFTFHLFEEHMAKKKTTPAVFVSGYTARKKRLTKLGSELARNSSRRPKFGRARWAIPSVLTP